MVHGSCDRSGLVESRLDFHTGDIDSTTPEPTFANEKLLLFASKPTAHSQQRLSTCTILVRWAGSHGETALDTAHQTELPAVRKTLPTNQLNNAHFISRRTRKARAEFARQGQSLDGFPEIRQLSVVMNFYKRKTFNRTAKKSL